MNNQKINVNQRDAELHKGHRERLRKKVMQAGLDCLSTHEVLELLLTYAIPRKDLNELSHRLLSSFGSLKNVLDAPINEIKKINGIGDKGALFLTILPQLFKMYGAKEKNEKVNLSNPQDLHKYFVKNIGVSDVEEVYVIFVDKNNNFLKSVLVAKGETHRAYFPIQEITKVISEGESKYYILIHTHPEGGVTPSYEDTKATKTLLGINDILRKQMLEHLIVDECSWFSFKREKNLDGLSRDSQMTVNKMFKDIQNS